MKTVEIVREFLELQKKYSFTKRATVTGERYCLLANSGLVDKEDFQNESLREPLLEHVGHLPILASYFYPFIENKEKINLGKVLIMLSIHDIGETVTGEISAYKKTLQDDIDEQQAALKILNPEFKNIFLEFEQQESWDSKYAKAIDAIAPNIREIKMPVVTIKRSIKLGFNIEDVIKKKRKYFEFDRVLLEVFDLLMEEYKKVGTDQDFIFGREIYDINLK